MAPRRVNFPSSLARPSVISLGLARAGARHIAKAEEKRHSKFKARSALTKLMCGIYCMIACVFGAVFPISDALAQTVGGQHLYYTEVFHCFMYGLGVICFAYFLILIMLQRRRLIASGKYKDIELDVISGMTASPDPSRRGTCEWDNDCTDLDNKVTRRLVDKEGALLGKRRDEHHEKMLEELEKDATVTYEAEGVNYYLRLGAMGFGVGGMVQSGFRISEPFENPNALQCRSLLFLINAGLYLIFVFLQTFFIFKYHKVVIHKQKALVRLCLMHILATNLSVWLSTTTHETAEDIGRMSAKTLHGNNSVSEHYAASSNWTFGDNESNHSVHSSPYTHSNEVEHIRSCHRARTLSDRSAPYLFPCLIEYSLIGAAVAYRTFLNVGKRVAKGESADEGAGVQFSEPVECHKSNRGLFLGLLVILVTFVSVALFFVFEEEGERDTSSGIFLSSAMFLFVISIIACIIGFFHTKQLAYVGLLDEDFFDDKLLLIAQMGVYLLSTCVSISSATAIFQNYNKIRNKSLPVMYLCMAILNFIQSSIQTIFILDGLRRCAATDEHMTKKPGRAAITFLLVCNLAMWVVNTFEIKTAEVVDIHVDFFRYMPWSIIMHLCFPLVIFYRFHSSVCLSAVWHTAYVKRGEVGDFHSLDAIFEESV